MQRTTMTLGIGAAIAGATMLTVAALGMNPTAGQQPNQGTVKIDGVDLDDVPNNEPHVDDCVFDVEFFGYPANQVVQVEVTAVEPTAGGGIIDEEVTLDGDDTSGGGSEAGFDGEITIDATSLVAGIDPQPQQGWHLRLEVDDDEVGGPKVKVFWVIGCEEPPPTTTTSTTSTSTTSTSTTSTSTTSTSTTSTTAPDETTTTTAPDETTTTTARDGAATTTTMPAGGAPPAPAARPPAPGAPAAPAPVAPAAPAVPVDELAVTGAGSWALAIAGSVLVFAGAALTVASRRRLAA